MPYQQNLASRTISLAIIRAKSNRLPDLLPHVPAILAALPSLKPNEVIQIGSVSLPRVGSGTSFACMSAVLPTSRDRFAAGISRRRESGVCATLL
jgi:hypothetical protein